MNDRRVINTFEEMARWLAVVHGKLKQIEQGDLADFSKSKVFEKEILKWWQDQLSIDVIKNIFYSESPTLQKYAPLKYRVGTPLLLTGLMREMAVRAAKESRYDNGYLITDLNEPFYWSWQNYGTYVIPQREFVGPRPDTMNTLTERVGDSIITWALEG